MRLHHKLEQEEHGQDVHSNAHLTIVSATEIYEDIAQVTQYYAVGDTVGEWHEQNADECRYGKKVECKVRIYFEQSLGYELPCDQDNQRGYDGLGQHQYKFIVYPSGQQLLFNQFGHQDTIDDQCNVVAHQHG